MSLDGTNRLQLSRLEDNMHLLPRLGLCEVLWIEANIYKKSRIRDPSWQLMTVPSAIRSIR
jgi:hypothetical protein